MNKNLPKFFPENDKENVIIEVTILRDNDTYKAVGVLIKESDVDIRLGFNAKNDKVIDYIDIEYKHILAMEKVGAQDILIFE